MEWGRGGVIENSNLKCLCFEKTFKIIAAKDGMNQVNEGAERWIVGDVTEI